MDTSDNELVKRFRAGDNAAATELFNRYSQGMLRMVQAKLRDRKNRAAYDSEGIVNSGFRSFFSAIQKPDFDESKWKIVALLSTIVSRKVLVKLRRKAIPTVDSVENERTLVETILVAEEQGKSQDVSAEWNALFEAIREERTELECWILAAYLNPNDPRTLEEIAVALGCSLTIVMETISDFAAELKRRLRDLQE